MTHTMKAVRIGGTWLATASLLMIAALVLHGPIASNLNDQMTRIANAAVRWSVAHWVAAAALSLYADVTNGLMCIMLMPINPQIHIR